MKRLKRIINYLKCEFEIIYIIESYRGIFHKGSENEINKKIEKIKLKYELL